MSAKMQTWSVFPMGKRYPRAFSSCRYCSSWQSTRYSMVFIICASASTARRSFSMRLCRNSGLKAISASASNTCSQRHRHQPRCSCGVLGISCPALGSDTTQPRAQCSM